MIWKEINVGGSFGGRVMKFRLSNKFEQTYIDIHEFDSEMIDAMAEVLTDEQYHELCHQLHGSKAEFDEVDGECSLKRRKKAYTVLSALSRGIFWQTLKALN